MAAEIIEHLMTVLGVDADVDSVERFDSALTQAKSGLIKVVVAAAAAASGIFYFTQKISDANDETGKLAQSLGISAAELQSLQYAADMNGGSIGSMNSLIESLTANLGDMANGLGGNIEGFARLGISVTDSQGKLKSTQHIIYDIADVLHKTKNQTQRIFLANQMGISQDLLLTLQQGSQALRQQQKDAKELGFLLSSDSTVAAGKFKDSVTNLLYILKGVTTEIGTRLMKVLTPMIELFLDWFKANKAIIQQNFSSVLETLVDILTFLFKIGFRVFNVINSIAKAMGGWKATITAVTLALIAMNASALLLPILILALGAGILLLLEDIIVFANEGDSALGALGERLPLINIALKGILNILGLIVKGWTALFSNPTEALEGLIALLNDWGKKLDLYLINNINKLIDLLNKIPFIDIDTTQKIGQVIDYSNKTQKSNGFDALHQVLASRKAQANKTSNVANTQNTDNKVTININGGDTQQIKKVVQDTLAMQFSGAANTLGSPVLY